MKSPFPGMDPYIEALGLWEDFHKHLTELIFTTLADVVPGRYFVRTGQRSYVVFADDDEKKDHPFTPDAGIKTTGRHPEVGAGVGSATATQTAVVEPAADTDDVILRPFIDERFRESFVEVYDTEPEQRLVTRVEVLSPSNKRKGTEGWDVYLRKRQALLLGGAHLVEIDLLRGGTKLPMLDPWPNAPYTLLVGRRSERRCRVTPAHFDRPLPAVKVPLEDPDPDVVIDLQPLVDSVYRRARYDRSIDYSKPLTPPLSEAQREWLAGRLRERAG